LRLKPDGPLLRVSSVDELFDVALALSNQDLPKGDRIAIITNAGGPGILAADAIESLGMQMAVFENKTLKHLRDNLPEVAAVNNPVDVIASGGPDSYREAMDAVLSDKNVDAVIVIFVPPIVVDHRAVIEAIVEMIEKHKNNKTVLGCFMSAPELISGSEELAKHHIPIYTFPESAAKAMSAMVRYRKWIERPEGKTIEFEVNKAEVKRILNDAAKSKKKIIVGDEALSILNAYGVEVAKSVKAKTQADIKKVVSKLKFPLVMKIDDPDVTHKTDVGGVMADLRDQNEVIDALEVMKSKFGRSKRGFAGVVLQEMVKGGVETIIGMNYDPSFGPLMMFGLGGIYVEVMKDVAFKVHPLTDFDAKEMIQSIKGYPLLTGFRGTAPVNLKVLEKTLLRISQLFSDFPIFESFDVNPFIVTTKGEKSRAVDARFVLKS